MTPAVLPRLQARAPDTLRGRLIDRVIDVAGDAERVGEVRGTDEEDVDAFDRGDGLDLVEGGSGFDLHDAQQVLVPPAGASWPTRPKSMPRVKSAMPRSPAGWVRSQRATWRACSPSVHLRDHDARCSKVQGAPDADALAGLDAHQGRGVGETGSHEQGQQVRLVGGAVLEVDEHPVEARASGHLHEEWGRAEDERAEDGLPGQHPLAQ